MEDSIAIKLQIVRHKLKQFRDLINETPISQKEISSNKIGNKKKIHSHCHIKSYTTRCSPHDHKAIKKHRQQYIHQCPYCFACFTDSFPSENRKSKKHCKNEEKSLSSFRSYIPPIITQNQQNESLSNIGKQIEKQKNHYDPPTSPTEKAINSEKPILITGDESEPPLTFVTEVQGSEINRPISEQSMSSNSCPSNDNHLKIEDQSEEEDFEEDASFDINDYIHSRLLNPNEVI